MNINLKRISNWYWLVIVVLLINGVTHDTNSFGLVIGVSSLQTVHYLIKTRDIMSIDVQYRLIFLCLMMLAQSVLFSWIYTVTLIGLIYHLVYSLRILEKLIKQILDSKKASFSSNEIKSPNFVTNNK